MTAENIKILTCLSDKRFKPYISSLLFVQCSIYAGISTDTIDSELIVQYLPVVLLSFTRRSSGVSNLLMEVLYKLSNFPYKKLSKITGTGCNYSAKGGAAAKSYYF